jgi:hypothetical protein
VPNFAQLKKSDPAHILPGYDYDVVTEEVILKRMSVRDSRLVLGTPNAKSGVWEPQPDGMSYRVLVLPNRPNISLPVLRKLKEFVAAGATVIGPKPQYPTGLTDFPKSDEEVARLAAEVWAPSSSKGRAISDKNAREVLAADGVRPDFEFSGREPNVALDYIHRRNGQTEIYFVANRSTRSVQADCTFRVTGKQPELWDAVTGQTRPAAAWSQAKGHTTLPLEFAPCGSIFVVFCQPAEKAAPSGPAQNFVKFTPRHEIPGPWAVRFDPNWGGPGTVQFPQLVSWPKRPEEGIKFYSGAAVYETSFDLPESLRGPGRTLVLDLGKLRELAEVRLNGKNLGVVWAPPFRMDVSAAIQPTGNKLEIEVVNFWPNRIIGDQSLPPEKRLTRTNIRKLTKDTPLIESGLLGPVTLGTP